MNAVIVLLPPIAFAVLILAALGLSFGLSRLAPGKRRAGKGMQPYACGEDIPSAMIQPSYAQFFPFAFFFTILHVVTLMIATVPVQTPAAFVIAGVYLLGAGISLIVLFSR